MRAKANARLTTGNSVSWVMELALWKRIVADYRRLYPNGRGHSVLRASFILWAILVITAVLAKILGAAI
jgi:hypothetical protein